MNTLPYRRAFLKRTIAGALAFCMASAPVAPTAQTARQKAIEPQQALKALSLSELSARSDAYQRYEANTRASAQIRGRESAPVHLLPNATMHDGKARVVIQSLTPGSHAIIFRNDLRSSSTGLTRTANSSVSYAASNYSFPGGDVGYGIYIQGTFVPPCTMSATASSPNLTLALSPNPTSDPTCHEHLDVVVATGTPAGNYTITVYVADSVGTTMQTNPLYLLLTVVAPEAYRHQVERRCGRCDLMNFGMSYDPTELTPTEHGLPDSLQEASFPSLSATHHLAYADGGASGGASAGVDLTNGETWYQNEDLSLAGPNGLRFNRFYGNQSSASGDLGVHWKHNYATKLDVSQMLSAGAVTYIDSQDMSYYFQGVSPGLNTYDNMSGLTLALNASGSQYTMTTFDGRVSSFNAKGELIGLSDRFGNTQSIARDFTSGRNDRISSVRDPLGRALCFYYDTSNRITTVSSWFSLAACPSSPGTSGPNIRFAYDRGTDCVLGDLCSATEPDGQTWRFHYFSTNAKYPTNLYYVQSPSGNIEVQFNYDDPAQNYAMTNKAFGECTGRETGVGLSGCYLPFETAVISYPSPDVTSLNGHGVRYDPTTLLPLAVDGALCGCKADAPRFYSYDQFHRITSAGNNGADSATFHSYTYFYQRDTIDGSGHVRAYPGPTEVLENIDASGATRQATLQYYPLGDPRQDLVHVTTYPSVDTSGANKTVTNTYLPNGSLSETDEKGYVSGLLTTITQTYLFDSRGRLKAETGPRSGQQTTFNYFSDSDSDLKRAGQLQGIVDAYGHAALFAAQSASGFGSYNAFGSPQSMVDPNGVVREYQYDARGRKIAETLLGVPGDASNLTASLTYDAEGLLKALTYPRANGLAYLYKSGTPVGIVRVDAAHAQHEQLETAFNDNNYSFVPTRTDLCSSPSSSCANWVNYEYFGFQTGSGNYSFNGRSDSKVAFDAAGNVQSFNDYNHLWISSPQFQFVRDVAGRLVEIDRMNPNVSSGYMSEFFRHDLADNLTQYTDGNGNTTQYVYDDFGHLLKELSPVTGTTTWQYDLSSNVVSTTDANGSIAKSTYDLLDRKTQSTSTSTTGVLETVQYSYDDPTLGNYGIGRLTSMTDPTGSTKYTYERRGNVRQENQTINGQVYARSYAYDGNGNVSSVTYPSGGTITYGYDFADRPVSAARAGSVSLAATSANRRYGVGSRNVNGSLSITGNLPTRESVRIGGQMHSWRASITPPAASTSSLLEIRRLQATPTSPTPIPTKSPTPLPTPTPTAIPTQRPTPSSSLFVSNATYDPFGPLTSMTFGNGTVQTITSDVDAMIAGQSHHGTSYLPAENKLVSASGNVLADYTYALDYAGNIVGIHDVQSSNYDRTFGYDDAVRLTSANSGSSLWGTATGNGYTYDNVDNITSIQLGSSRVATLSYRANPSQPTASLPQLSSVIENGRSRSVTYDAGGNEKSIGSASYTYSPRGKLANGDGISYSYDGFGRRTVSSTSAGQRLTLFGASGDVLAETAVVAAGAPPIAYEYVWFGDRPVAQVDGGGTHWTLTDHLGTPLLQTDINSNVTWRAEHEPYGKIWALRGGDIHQPVRLPGQTSEQFDLAANGATERSYNNARWYDPGLGRFTQPDPLGVSGSPFNPYSYSSANPIAGADPTGLDDGGLPAGAQEFVDTIMGFYHGAGFSPIDINDALQKAGAGAVSDPSSPTYQLWAKVGLAAGIIGGPQFGSSRNALRRSLENALRPCPGAGYEAHHIFAWKDARAKWLRDLAEKVGIALNDPVNGAWMKAGKGGHSATQMNAYFDYITKALEPMGDNADAVHQWLTNFAKVLESGRQPWK